MYKKIVGLMVTMTFLATGVGPVFAQQSDVTPAPEKAVAVRYEIEDGSVFIVQGEQKEKLDLPAKAEFLLVTRGKMYVALGDSGVIIYSIEDKAKPILSRTVRPPYGRITGLHETEGQVWMEISSVTAMPLASLPEQPLKAKFTPSEKVSPPDSGVEKAPESTEKEHPPEPIQILSIKAGRVELSSGSDQGVRVGDRFSIFRTISIEGEEGAVFTGRELGAVVRVTAVKDDRCLADLGRGARVSKQDMVEPARPEEDISLIYSQKLDGIFEAVLVVRPLLKIGKPLGVGTLTDMWINYTGGSYFAGLRIQPLGLAWTQEGDVVSTSFLAEGGYDTTAFAVGLGLGVSNINGDMDYLLERSFIASAGTTRYSQRTQSAFAFSQLVRLGSRDGFHLWVCNIFLYHKSKEDDSEGFIYGGTTGQLVIPVSERVDLFFEGGGGRMGYAFGAIGTSVWIIGNGDKGSLALSVSVGGAEIWGTREVKDGDYSYSEEVSVAGPMISFGLNYRFGLW